MEAGKLRHRIEIQEAAEAANTIGEIVKTWATVATIWADKQPIRGLEYFSAMQAKASVDTKFIIRDNAFPALSPKHRVIHSGGIYDIESVINTDGRGIEIEINCKSQA